MPAQLTERVHAHLRCMKGTNEQPPRCIALQGEVGKQVACAIYELRPSTCREFNMFEEDGTPNEHCFSLRTQAGLITKNQLATENTEITEKKLVVENKELAHHAG